jgi:hypothetical protein
VATVAPDEVVIKGVVTDGKGITLASRFSVLVGLALGIMAVSIPLTPSKSTSLPDDARQAPQSRVPVRALQLL